MADTADKETTYFRLPRDLKQRLQRYATQMGDSLTDAVADLLVKGLEYDDAKEKLRQSQTRIPQLETEKARLESQLTLQAQVLSQLRDSINTYDSQIRQLSLWLQFPIARCKQHCQKEASIQHVVYNQCPQTGGPSPFGFELLSQYERQTPLDVIKNLAGFVGVVSVLSALGGARDQRRD